MSTHHPLSSRREMLLAYTAPLRWPLLVLFLIMAATIAVQLAAPILTARFIDHAIDGAPIRELLTIALTVIGIALAGQVLAPVETWVSEHIGWEATNRLRADLLEHLLRLDASFHARHTVGELIERVDGDVANLARFFSRFVVTIVGNGIMLLGIVVLLVRLDWRVGAAIALVLLLAVVAMLRIRVLATPAWARERQAAADFYGFLGEILAAREDVRSNNAAAYVSHRLTMLLRALYTATGKAGMFGYGLGASTGTIFALGTIAVLAIGATQYRAGAMTLGAVYLAFQYTQMLRRPVNELRDEIQDLQQADASLARIASMLAIRPAQDPAAGIDLPAGPLGVAMDDVTFGYDPNDPVLREVSVRIPAGRVLGIVGRTGSGKTTLARLLTRAWTPQSGTIVLETATGANVPLADLRLDEIRQRIALVTQDVAIFGASLRDNLTLFNPSVPDDRLLDVLADVGLGDWLAALPDGLETRLRSGGDGLSAGEAQLIACARVLLREPDIVVLDEASSRLDPATEWTLHQAFARLLEGRTGVIIAHRIETLHLAGDILVLERGEVVEHGPREALEADPASRFARLLETAEGALV